MSLALSVTPPQNPTFVGIANAESEAVGSFVRSRRTVSPILNVSNHPWPGSFGPSGEHGARNGDIIVLPEDSSNFCYRSTDGGITYSSIAYSDSSARAICHIGSGVMVASVYNRARVEVSYNSGLTWTNQVGVAFTGGTVDYANGYLLLTNLTASTGALLSTDGVNWNAVTLPFAANKVLNINGALTIWNTAGTSIGIATSADCSTWATFTAPAVVTFVAYGNGTYAIASGLDFYQSPDLINWRKSTVSLASAITGLVFAPEYGLFIACGGNLVLWGSDVANLTWYAQSGIIPVAVLIPMSGGGAPYYTQGGSTHGMWTIEPPLSKVTTE